MIKQITIDGVEYIPKTAVAESLDLSTSNATFLRIGNAYLFRTVTMIYTGKIKAITQNEILLECAAWIPETERWAQTVKDCVFKEVEPYAKDVILFRGAILDVTEIDKLPLDQK